MATVQSQTSTCRIVKDRILELEMEAGRLHDYNGVVVIEDKLLVIDSYERNLQLYNHDDGKLMTSHKLESDPMGICLISDTEVAVCLIDGTVLVVSMKSRYHVQMVRTLRTVFDRCYSLAKWNSDKLVVSGWKYGGMMRWCVLSITDGHMDSTHIICQGIWTHIAIIENSLYISCWTYDSSTEGVYGYDICNPHTKKFLYQHQQLRTPGPIMSYRDCVYVCDLNSNRIHQLTDSGQLVTIHTVSSSLYKTVYDVQQELLYTTSKDSNMITVYKLESSHQPGVPLEILKMDDRSIKLFEEALKDGEETVHSIRIMVVGHMGVGKTTLVKRLLGEEVNISERHSTEGIDVYVNCCDVSLSTHEWTRRTKDSGQDYRLQRIAKVLNETHSLVGNVSDEQVVIPLEEDITESLENSHAAVENWNIEVLNRASEQGIDQELSPATDQQEESTVDGFEESSADGFENFIANDFEESSADEFEDSSADELEEVTSDLQEDYTDYQHEDHTAQTQLESAAHQLKKYNAHKFEEYTPHQQEEYTFHQQEELIAHQKYECTAHQQDKVIPHQHEESTDHQQKESAGHQQTESTAHQQEEFIAHQQNEYTAHQQKKVFAHQHEESTSHQHKESTPQQKEFTLYQQEVYTAHQHDECTAITQEDSTDHQQEETSAHQQEETTVHNQKESSVYKKKEYTGHQQKEYIAIQQDDSTVTQQENSTAHQQDENAVYPLEYHTDLQQEEYIAYQREESTVFQQEVYTAHQQEEYTAPQQEEYTAHQQEDYPVNHQEDSNTHQQEESIAHQQEEYTVYQREEYTAHLQEELIAHQQEEYTAPQQEEYTAHQQEDYPVNHQEDSTTHQQEESIAHQQEEYTVYQREEYTAHLQEELIAHQQEESIAYQKDKYTAHQQEESIAHQQEEPIDYQKDKYTAHQQDEYTVYQLEKYVANRLEDYTTYHKDEYTARHQDEYTAHQQEKSIANHLEDYTTYHKDEYTARHQDEYTAHQIEKSIAHQEEKSVVQKKPTHFKTNTMAMLKLLKENVHKIEGASENSLLTIWDFAGQYAFYTTHQTFLTRRAIYLLVSDVSGQVTDLVADDCYFDSKGVMKCQVHELVEVWLNSIHSCASSPEDDSPPVILVGTHVDKISQDKTHEICESYFREIRSYLKDKPTRFHLIDEDFAIDNSIEDSKLEDLKRKIVEVASQQPYWGEKIPARWLPLEQELMRRKADGVKVISRKDVEKINNEGTVPIENSEELDLFLRFLHETGTIIYFSIYILRENIVLDPTWLIDALKTLINAQPDLPDGSADNAVSQKWSDFKEKGILSLELIDAIWTKDKYPELHAHKDHILLIMEQLNIIAKPRAFSEIGEKIESCYLAPCMLRQESPREIISPEQDPLMVSTPVLCCVFTGNFLPPPIFHRLIAACITRWPVAKKKDTSENLIFCGCCIFNIDLFHRLTLHCKNHIIFARITRMVVDEVKTPDAMLCTRVRKFITLNLSKITSYLGQNLSYELCTWWSPSKVVSDDGRAPPFQMWFADEGHDYDAPITSEHMNHARLYVALMTVCTNALREILLTHVPKPHINIYQAIRAKKDDLTRKTHNKRRQWQSALLIPDQCQVVFPDPRGRYVASVDQFDISLLYILIRHVSTVSASVMNWGIDPIEKPFRDRCLGASVERIRLYRNQIGHSIDGKMSQHDFDDYWNKIDAVLDDIEQVLGRQVYRAQLEKQREQVISIYEAC
ncbi:hypothetical protein ACJMK2_001969 [Sinanodonta woodiana]|uniref:DZIP3-like HEPN domain-containing protein n=1 Tax=Sinanodonta woodiana TaxID=1069815 RepID=A0ABD3XX84_SINWO